MSTRSRNNRSVLRVVFLCLVAVILGGCTTPQRVILNNACDVDVTVIVIQGLERSPVQAMHELMIYVDAGFVTWVPANTEMRVGTMSPSSSAGSVFMLGDAGMNQLSDICGNGLCGVGARVPTDAVVAHQRLAVDWTELKADLNNTITIPSDICGQL